MTFNQFSFGANTAINCVKVIVSVSPSLDYSAEHNYRWALMWTHRCFKDPPQNSGPVSVPEYKFEMTRALKMGVNILGAQCVNTPTSHAGAQSLVLGHQVWTWPNTAPVESLHTLWRIIPRDHKPSFLKMAAEVVYRNSLLRKHRSISDQAKGMRWVLLCYRATVEAAFWSPYLWSLLRVRILWRTITCKFAMVRVRSNKSPA